MTKRAKIALAAMAMGCLGGFTFVASAICGVTANNPHSHAYAVAGWTLFALSAGLLTSAAVTALVAEETPRE